MYLVIFIVMDSMGPKQVECLFFRVMSSFFEICKALVDDQLDVRVSLPMKEMGLQSSILIGEENELFFLHY